MSNFEHSTAQTWFTLFLLFLSFGI